MPPSRAMPPREHRVRDWTHIPSSMSVSPCICSWSMSVGLTRDVTVGLRDWERRDRKTSRLDPTRTGRFTLTDADTATRLADWTAGQTAAMTELLVRPPRSGRPSISSSSVWHTPQADTRIRTSPGTGSTPIPARLHGILSSSWTVRESMGV